MNLRHVDYVTCECEHIDHDGGTFIHARSALFEAESLIDVKTIYGTFSVCKECDTVHIPNEYRKSEVTFSNF